MGIGLSVLSVVLFVTETVLQLYVAIRAFQESVALFVMMVGLILGSFIVVNITSAVLVLRTMDFSGKGCGKIVCMLLHVLQLGLIWRFLKLLLLYEEHDWLELINLRLIHTVLQSLPFVIVKGYTIFHMDYMDQSDVSIATVCVSIISSAVALTTFNVGEKLFSIDEFDENKAKMKKNFGIFFLIIGTMFVLVARCASIVLFAIFNLTWVSVPLGTHMLVFLLSTTIYALSQNKLTCSVFLKKIAMCFVSLFDLMDTGFKRIQCKYVLYYTAILVENIVMTAIWMTGAADGYVLKLVTVVIVLMGFLCGMILKFASCGCIHDHHYELEPFSDVTLQTAQHISNSLAVSATLESRKVLVDRHVPNGMVSVPNGKVRHKGDKNSQKEKGAYKINFFPFDIEGNEVDMGSLYEYENGAFENNETTVDADADNSITISADFRKKSIMKKEGSVTSQLSENRHVQFLYLERKRQKCADGASSNSRNTNTLNTSLQSSQSSGQDRRIADDKNRPNKSSYSKNIERPSRARDMISDCKGAECQKRTVRDFRVGQSSSNNCHITFVQGHSEVDGRFQNDSYQNGESGYISLPYTLPGSHESSRTLGSESKSHESNKSQEKCDLYSNSIYGFWDGWPNISMKKMTNRSDDKKLCSNFRKPVCAINDSLNFDFNESFTDTTTSFSDYLSNNGFTMDSTTDWSSCSTDSDCAQTWPPSNSILFPNLNALPKDKISPKDSVLLWLRQLDQSETPDDCVTMEEIPKFRSMQDLGTGKSEKTSHVRKKSNGPGVPNLPSGRKSSGTKISPRKQQTHKGKPVKRKLSRILGNSKGMLFKFCSVNQESGLRNSIGTHHAHEPLKQKTKMPFSHPIRKWHPEENLSQNISPDIVQESMV